MEIKPQKIRIASVLNSLFFPFTFPDVIESLKKRGFSIPSLPESIPTGQKAYLGGHIAAKKDCLVELNPDKNLVAVDSFSNNINSIMQELLSIATTDFHVNLAEELDYSELTGHYIVMSDNNPLESIRKLRCEHFDKFNEIFDVETTPYNLSIVPEGLTPMNRNWFEVRIEPRITMPSHSYYIIVVYRNKNHEKVMNFSQNINSNITSLIESIEEI